MIQVVDRALPPDRKSFPRPKLFTAVALAVGFLLGVFLAFVDAALARMKKDPASAVKLVMLRDALRITRARVP